MHPMQSDHLPLSLLARADNSGGTVRAGRRRPSGPSHPEGRERAKTPERSRPPGGGGGGFELPSPPGPLMGGSGRPVNPMMVLVMLGILCLSVICGGPSVVKQFFGGEEMVIEYPTDAPGMQEVGQLQGGSVTVTSKPPQLTTPPQISPGQTWLVMLYQDADDKILEQDIYIDLNEAERAGSSGRVNIVSQTDRYQAAFRGDGDWTTTRRYFITPDGDLGRLGSQVLFDLGEANMADGQTLVDFATWAMAAYPADKVVLILSDHGMGWPGGWSDSSERGRGGLRGVPLADMLGDQLYLMELDQALGQIRDKTGLEQFELIGLDACLMGGLEVYSTLAPHARYAVASEEVEPALGWAYTSFLQALNENPDVDGAQLGGWIVESYVADDQRVVDDAARAEFLSQGRPMGGFFGGGPSAAQLARQLEESATLSAVDLAAIDGVMASVDELALRMQQSRQPEIAKVRNYAQAFTNIFGSDTLAAYLDLGNFAQLLRRETSNSDVAAAALAVQEAVDRAVIAEKHGPKKAGATGISIYFPSSQLYRLPVAGPSSYTAIASRFAEQSSWDDFLAYHYTGRAFEAGAGQAVMPDPGAAVRGPGAGAVQVSPLELLGVNTVAPGQTSLLRATIQGENIGHIYIFAGFLDQAANSLNVADMDFLESPESRQVEGMYYPLWSEETEWTLEFEWEPLVFGINDGEHTVSALLTPQSYGATPAEAIYTVDGAYTFAESGEGQPAQLVFSNGVLRQVVVFSAEEGASPGQGAPREILPQPGDTFTVYEKWFDLDADGRVAQVAYQAGETLTFGAQPFTWRELDAAAGQYVVGFIVEDMDGNRYPAYAAITVR